MERARAQARRECKRKQQGKAVDEAEHREGQCRPGQREAGETGAETVGQKPEQRLRDGRHPAVSEAHEANRREAELELADEQGVKDRKDSNVAVEREVAEHQRQQLSVPQEVAHYTAMMAAVGGLLYLSRADVAQLLDFDAMLDALAGERDGCS